MGGKSSTQIPVVRRSKSLCSEEEWGDDREEVLKRVGKNGIMLRHVSSQLRNDKDIVLAATAKNGLALKFASKQQQDDKEVVLTAVSNPNNICAFEHASERLRADREIVVASLQHYPGTFRYTSRELQGDEEIAALAVSKDGTLLEYASDEIKNNESIVKIAIEQNTGSLQFASVALRGNKSVVMSAVSIRRGLSLQYASLELRKDVEIVKAAIQHDHVAFEFSLITAENQLLQLAAINGMILQYLPKMNKNKNIVLAAVTQNGQALKFASEKLKSCKEIVLAAVKNNGSVIREASESMKADREVVWAAVQNQPYCLRYTAFVEDKQMHLDLIEAGIYEQMHFFSSHEPPKDKEIVMKAMGVFTILLEEVGENLRSDDEVIRLAIAKCGTSLDAAPHAYKDNKEIVLSAVKQNGYSIQYASERLKEDREIIKIAMGNTNGDIWHFVPPTVWEDREFVLKILETSHGIIAYSKTISCDEELVLHAISHNVTAFRFIDDSLKHKEDFVRKAVTVNGLVLKYLREPYCEDINILLSAVAQGGRSVLDDCVSENWKHNLEFAMTLLRDNDERDTLKSWFSDDIVLQFNSSYHKSATK